MRVIFRFKEGHRLEHDWKPLQNMPAYFRMPKSHHVELTVEESMNPMLAADESWTFMLRRQYIDEYDKLVAIYDCLDPLL